MATNPNTNTETTAVSSASLYLQETGEIEKVFKQFDANGDGLISVTELGDVLKSMGSTYTAAELERVMKDIDSDADGFINMKEFEKLCRASSTASSAAEELRDAFDLYDQNKDGLISSAELHQVLNRIGIKCSVEECAKMIRSVDSDGDGSVNFQEFEKMMASNVTNNAA